MFRNNPFISSQHKSYNMLIKNVLITVAIVSTFLPVVAWSQPYLNLKPPESAPPLAPNAAPPPPQLATSTSVEAPFPGLEHLQGIVILGSTNDFKPEGVSGVSGVTVKGPAFLKEHQELVFKTLSRFLGKPLTPTAMTNLQVDLILLCRHLDRPIVDVFYPGDSQEIVDATVQVMVYEGKFDHVVVKHETKVWFNDSIITNRLHLNHGDSISQRQLLKDVGRMNLNPVFREVDAGYEPGEWSEDGHGTTTVDLDVKERFPLQVFGGYDDYGLRILGENQVFGGFTYGNLFGADQQFTYKYTTDIELDRLQAHTASYVVPLPWWGNNLTISGGYTSVKPDFAAIDHPEVSLTNGWTYQISLRYLIPLPGWFGLNQDISFGYDFKSASTPVQVLDSTIAEYKADIDQFAVDYRAYLRDGIGFSQFTGSGYYSPGDLLGRNSDKDFATFGPGLKSDYYYGRIEGIRAFNLPLGLQLRGRAGLQEASTALLPSEQLYLGGYSILRGYPESVVSGDTGWYASAELHSPLIRTGNLTREHNVPNVNGDMLDIFGFFDTGSVQPIDANLGLVAPGTPATISLDSAGGGLSWRIGGNFQATGSYGYQLKDLPSGTPAPLTKAKGRFDISATLSF
jgi:hemolysin activation/secretion protein